MEVQCKEEGSHGGLGDGHFAESIELTKRRADIVCVLQIL